MWLVPHLVNRWIDFERGCNYNDPPVRFVEALLRGLTSSREEALYPMRTLRGKELDDGAEERVDHKGSL